MHVLNKRFLFSRLLRDQAAGETPAAGGGQAAAAAAPAVAPAVPATPPADSQATAPAWHDSIQDAGLKAFIQGKGFKDAGDAVRALHDLEGLTAKPESADAYKLPVPDGQDAAFATEASKWMHEAGIPVAQAQALAAKWNQYQADVQKDADTERQQQGERDVQALKKEWGGEYDANTELARRAVRTFGADEQMLEKLSKSLGDGETLRLFHRIGKHLGEGTLIPAGGDRGASPPANSDAARAARMFPSMKSS